MSRADRRIGDAILGCLLIEPDLVQHAEDIGLTERHFYHLPHQLVFRSIRALWAAGQQLDLVTVEHDLNQRGTLADIGGTEFLTGLFDVIPTSANFRGYVDRLFQEHEEFSRKISVETALKLIEEGNPTGANYLLQQALDLTALRKAPPKTLAIESYGEMNQDLSIPPLVEDFLATETVSMLFGASNTGKSFVALDLAFSIATGRAWAARRVLQGGVIYVAAESPGSIRRRVMALRKVYAGIDHAKVPLWMVPIPVDLVTDNSGIESLIATTTEIQRRHTVRLVIVDTLACTMAGGDENSFQTMGALAGRLGRLRGECSVAVLGVHHAGKDHDKGARGHSSLRAAVDTELELRHEDGVRSVTITKARDGDNGIRVGFELDPVSIGRDANGTDVQVPTVRWLSSNATTPLPGGRALGVLMAGLGAFRASGNVYITEREWLASYASDPDCRSGLSDSSLRRTFTRHIESLIPVWFTRQGVVFHLTKAGQKALSEQVHTIYPHSPRQDIVDTTVSVARTTPEVHSDGKNRTPSDTPGQRRDTGFRSSDTGHLTGPEADSDTSGALYRGGSSVRTSGLSVQDVEEQEARARIESLKPKNE